MAFRSELDAMRDRAEGAEAEARRLGAELESQATRMDRVAEIESQLESARAKLREREAPRPLASLATALAVVGGVVLGGVGATTYGRVELARAREASALDEARRSAEARSAEAALSAARREADALRDDRDGALAELAAVRADARDVLFALPSAEAGATAWAEGGARAVPLGRVAAASGGAPVALDDSCELVILDGEAACVAQIRCGAGVLTAIGCPGVTAPRVRGRGLRLVVESELGDWRVEVTTAPRTVAAGSDPAVGITAEIVRAHARIAAESSGTDTPPGP